MSCILLTRLQLRHANPPRSGVTVLPRGTSVRFADTRNYSSSSIACIIELKQVTILQMGGASRVGKRESN